MEDESDPLVHPSSFILFWMEVGQSLGQQEPGPIQAPLHGLLRNANYACRLGMRQPLNADEVENLSFILREALNCLQHAAAVRGEAGSGAHGWARDICFRH